ncbi:hypothetical protein [Tessaracoccus sp. OH4464_COT-324]|uniref:hypothetical protein n=1 Tax=Tessaracoccus sp. OH4464_COT-324 TaxID=2491059 RepID=UPI00131A273E|nr:hypothetical protein [Tessaracoccus sp. OH4464_COT-324]
MAAMTGAAGAVVWGKDCLLCAPGLPGWGARPSRLLEPSGPERGVPGRAGRRDADGGRRHPGGAPRMVRGIVEAMGVNGRRDVGIVADPLGEVVQVPAVELIPAPRRGATLAADGCRRRPKRPLVCGAWRAGVAPGWGNAQHSRAFQAVWPGGYWERPELLPSA